MAKILVVDDELTSVNIIRKVLQDAGYDVTTAMNGESALDQIKQIKFDIVITDFTMPGMNGIELTKKMLSLGSDLIVIFLTANISVQLVVEAMRLGAFDYLPKPINKEELLLSVNRGLERISLLKENLLLRHELEKVDSTYPDYATQSPKINDILKDAVKVAKSDSSILITGSNGTGKEVMAKFIYKHSNRSNQQFIVINCAAIPEQLLESELFGHVKGSFTGAIKDHKGYFEIADNGTLFLDEIGDLDPLLQVKLLRVLQEKQFSKVGDTRLQTTNVRILAATNRDLKQLIKEGKFREDFFYRLNVFEFHIPALKERPEDVLFYFDRFVNEFAAHYNKKVTVTPEVKSILENYEWPGNIRELKNVAERVTILCENERITPDLLPSSISHQQRIPDLTSSGTGGSNGSFQFNSSDYNESKELIIKDFEVKFITHHLHKNNGNIAATAKEINFHPVSLRQKIAKLGINVKDYKNQ
jgi:DNA-binding NtrC family response regulator